MKKQTEGKLVFLDGESFYKIENFDCMSDFFMTITSSSDVWNFCWAHGGITAGRKNSSLPLFPYYTSDKISDIKSTTGAVTIIKIKSEGKKGVLWQPFKKLSYTGADRFANEISIQRNLYKNLNGSKIWFEEINLVAGLAFRYGWTSSAKYGLVKTTRIENLTEQKINLEILDGCQNIMPSSADESIQNTKSVLFDAYKKSEVDEDFNVALFSLSSIVTDKAEPSESLNTNVSWFTTTDPIVLSEKAVEYFVSDKMNLLSNSKELNGKRGECYIIHESKLLGKSAECWEQVLDVDYDYVKLLKLESEISDRSQAFKLLLEDVEKTEAELTEKIAEADGIQSSKNEINDLHHRTNVMFNIMRGGLFYNGGKINLKDFKAFASMRNKKEGEELSKILDESSLNGKEDVLHDELKKVIFEKAGKQAKRLFLEYVPLTFSRRHGDPSRPWNKFNIELKNSEGKAKINWEGNWRDIFQNWEAVLWSYPEYIENAVSIFLNAMTVEGYNPYRISRAGIDWEIPEKGNPWAQFGYWGDHQVIYLQKFLEFLKDYNKTELHQMLNEKLFSTSNIPYVIKKYSDVREDPRNSISFDYDKDKALKAKEKSEGTDARLIQNKDGSVQLTSMTTKLLQIILAKMLNHVPQAGIWMNTQRPEWNDANNALAGWGASVVTMCYLYRMLSFLSKLFKENDGNFQVSTIVASTLKETFDAYNSFAADVKKMEGSVSDQLRKSFTDTIGLIFEKERDQLYKEGFGETYTELTGKELAEIIDVFASEIKNSILANRRSDGLFHAYNSLIFSDSEIRIANLKLMLEGQVAVLSSGILTQEEATILCDSLRKSDLFEINQHSYMLYPNTRLPDFKKKNVILEDEVSSLENLIERTGNLILPQDINGQYHFNAAFKNADIMKEFLDSLPDDKKPSKKEKEQLLSLYEKHFQHQLFTGRSGTFYSYEGLGCIYWHMVSKLLLAVQENITDSKDELFAFYKDIKKGLGAAKKPSEYGAFPFDPYSHTPFKQGAKQPGMTGQVKEEILARWKELGVSIKDGKAVFAPFILENTEFDRSGKISFTWCGTKIVYNKKQTNALTVHFADGKKAVYEQSELPEAESKMLFGRTGEIQEISVCVKGA